MTIQEYRELACNIRKDVLKLTYEKKAGFIGSSFSCADILAVLMGGYLNLSIDNPKTQDRDLLIMSKGHAASGLYAGLANIGAMSKERLFSEFNCSGYKLGVHPKRNANLGIETSTGSLGQGLGLGCGAALSMKMNGINNRVYVILGDGECNEGSIWESLMFASRYKLNNLILIVDRNRLQSYGSDSQVLNMGEMVPRLESFGWNTMEADGHDVAELDEVFRKTLDSDKPTAIIANTIKGKGVSCFENEVIWHYKWPEDEHYEKGMKELTRDEKMFY